MTPDDLIAQATAIEKNTGWPFHRELRCAMTGNLCGTDTRDSGFQYDCSDCHIYWLVTALRDALVQMQAAWIGLTGQNHTIKGLAAQLADARAEGATLRAERDAYMNLRPYADHTTSCHKDRDAFMQRDAVSPLPCVCGFLSILNATGAAKGPADAE